MKNYLKIALSFLIYSSQIVANQKSYATSININVTTSDIVAACKENHFTATYIAPGKHWISIAAFLTMSSGNTNTNCDDSSNLHPNVYIIIDTIINASITNPVTTTIGHNCIWRDSLVATANATVVIKYRLAIDCSAIDSSGSNLTLNQRFTDNGIGLNTFIVNNSFPPNDTLFNTVVRPFF